MNNQLKNNVIFNFNNFIKIKCSPKNLELSLIYCFTYYFFLWSVLYTGSYLPYGRFFSLLGGNIGSLTAFFYIFFYLTFNSIREPKSISIM